MRSAVSEGRTRDAHARGRAELRASTARPGSSLDAMSDRPTTADELRRAFLDFFVARGHTEVPSASVIPVDKIAAVHDRGHGPVQELLRRRGDAAVPAGDLVAEVRARGRQAQRPRRHRPHQPSLLVLRDARQLQLRRLLQGRGDPVGEGALPRRAAARHEPALGHGPRGRRRSRAHLARRRRASRPTGSSASATTTGGAWATPARAARRRRSSGISAPSYGPDGGPRDRPRPLHRDLEPRVHAVRPARRRHARPAAEAEHRHRRGPRAQPARRAGQDVDLGHRRVPPAHRAGRAAHRRALRRDRAHRRVAAHHRRALARDDLHDRRRRAAVEQRARLRAAPHHPPRGAARVPARRARSRAARRWSTPRSR